MTPLDTLATISGAQAWLAGWKNRLIGPAAEAVECLTWAAFGNGAVPAPIRRAIVARVFAAPRSLKHAALERRCSADGIC